MTVKEFIKYMQQFPEDALVVMSKDGEGNDFSPFSDADVAFYVPDSGWSGERWTEEDLELGEEDSEEALDEEPGMVKAVFLWPNN